MACPISKKGAPAFCATICKLLDGRRAVDIAGGQQAGLALLFQMLSASLPHMVVLPAPCRPHIMMTVGGRLGEIDALVFAAQKLRHLLVDDLDDLLARCEAL